MLENIESIVTITISVITALVAAVFFVISKVPTRRQVDNLRSDLSGIIVNMKADINEDVQNKIDSNYKDIKHLIELMQQDLGNLQDISKKK